MNELVKELMVEILEEEKQREIKRKEIIKNGCPCTNKIKRIATISKIEFLECDVCYKQFDLKGEVING